MLQGERETQWVDARAWAPSAADPPAVDVFRLVVSDSAGRATWLSAAEGAWLEQLTLAAPRQRFVAGRTALRALLSRALGCPPADVPLTIGPHGKPGIPERISQGLAFNLSHTASCIVVALSQVEKLGVDVERVRPRLNLEALAQRVLTTEERASLPTAEAERLHTFHRFWVAKEAYLKAWGTGLSFAPSRCRMRIEGGISLASSQMPDEQLQSWHFVEFDAGETLVACVCWAGAGRSTRFWRIEASALPALAFHAP